MFQQIIDLVKGEPSNTFFILNICAEATKEQIEEIGRHWEANGMSEYKLFVVPHGNTLRAYKGEQLCEGCKKIIFDSEEKCEQPCTDA